MIDKLLKEKIEARAFAIWEWRQANSIPGTAIEDWIEAESDIIADRRVRDGCPKCGFSLLARNNSEIFCLKAGCDFKIEAKRKLDKDIPSLTEIKKDWT